MSGAYHHLADNIYSNVYVFINVSGDYLLLPFLQEHKLYFRLENEHVKFSSEKSIVTTASQSQSFCRLLWIA